MCRTIVEIGPISIHSYGLMIAAAFFVGLWYVHWRSKFEKLSFDRMLTICYIFIFAGVIGGRLSFVALHWEDYAGNVLSAFNPFQGEHFGIAGLNLYGGVLLAVISALVYIWVKKMPLMAVFDLFAPTLGLGIGIGRIGCFLNGCCFGLPTDLPWGVHFPEDSIPYYYFGDRAIHPSQLYTSLYGVIIFLLLNWLIKRKRFDGQVLAVLFMMESFFRYLVEYVRYYEVEMRVSLLGFDLTYNQLTSIIFFIVGLVIYLMSPRNLYRESITSE